MSAIILPIGLVLALIVAILFPAPGTSLKDLGIVPWMVVTIFVINGFQTSLNNLQFKKKILITLLAATIINLFIAPILGSYIALSLQLSEQITIGLIVAMAVPATLSSGIVITGLAGGDTGKALFFTIALNLIGIFSIPFMLQWMLNGAGLVELSSWPLLKQLLSIVLLPFVVGLLIQKVHKGKPFNKLIGYIPSLCVITTAWVSLSSSAELLKSLNAVSILLILAASVVAHCALLALCTLYKLLHRVERGEWLAMLFTASQKTLPVAVGVLTSLKIEIGVALVTCILLHFVQLFIDSILANRFARRTDVTID